ncbi:MAG: transposase [Anaerolineales bacterium]
MAGSWLPMLPIRSGVISWQQRYRQLDQRRPWPHTRRRADALGAWLIFVDESGFLLIPSVKRTWAPKGETPTARYLLKHKKISAISALAISPQRKRIALYPQFRSKAFKGPEGKRFLEHLLKQLRGPIFLLCDQVSIHK